jgi:hypothetical protein
MRRLVRQSSVFVAVALLAASCERPSSSGAVTPGVDHHPPARTSDGRVVGADDKSPQHLLAEQGTTAHPAPGWKIDRNGVSYDPKRGTNEAKGATTIAGPDGGVEVVPARANGAPAPLPEE